MCRDELSGVVARPMSKRCWSRWKWWWGVNEMPSPFPCSPVIRECSWKKTQIEKKNFIINSPDTDVFVVGYYQFTSILITLKKLWLKTNTGVNKRYVAIYETANHFRSSMLESLLALHAVTGCDSVSRFSEIGKETALTTLKSKLSDLMEI